MATIHLLGAAPKCCIFKVPYTDGIFAPKEYELEGDTTERDIIVALGKAIKDDESALASLKKKKDFESLWRDVEEIAAEAGESLN